LKTPRLRLYHYWRSSSSWRVRWAFALKQLECEYVAVNLLEGEQSKSDHLARSPMGLVPTLELVGGDALPGGRFLSESLAIIEWAETQRPAPPLFPREPMERARARQLAEIINAGTQPIQNLGVQRRHSSDPEEQKRWARHWTERGLGAYEAVVSRTAGVFSVGDEITIADLCLIPQCSNADRQGVALDPYPTIRRIREAALATEACRATEPDRFKPV
jgi:maleylacetoacetate isomerase